MTIPRVKRLRMLLAGAALMGLASAVAIPVAFSSNDPAPTDSLPLGSGSTALLAELRDAPPLSAHDAEAVQAFDEIDTSRAVEVAAVEGVRFFVSASRGGEARFCAFAIASARPREGVGSSFTCLPRAQVGSGVAVLALPLSMGGIEQPQTYFGVVPDTVAAVQAGGTTHRVTRNVFGFGTPRGDIVSDVRYELKSGDSREVPVFNP